MRWGSDWIRAPSLASLDTGVVKVFLFSEFKKRKRLALQILVGFSFLLLLNAARLIDFSPRSLLRIEYFTTCLLDKRVHKNNLKCNSNIKKERWNKKHYMHNAADWSNTLKMELNYFCIIRDFT